MKKEVHYIILPVFAISLLFTSCKKEEPGINNTAAVSDIMTRNGMLVFKDETVLKTTSNKLEKMTGEEVKEWEKSYGFVSQKSIFENIVDAEYNLLMKPYENMTDEQLKRTAPPAQPHSDLYYTYMNKELIKVINKGTEDESYDYSVCNPALASIINERGFVAVGMLPDAVPRKRFNALAQSSRLFGG